MASRGCEASCVNPSCGYRCQFVVKRCEFGAACRPSGDDGAGQAVRNIRSKCPASVPGTPMDAGRRRLEAKGCVGFVEQGGAVACRPAPADRTGLHTGRLQALSSIERQAATRSAEAVLGLAGHSERMFLTGRTELSTSVMRRTACGETTPHRRHFERSHGKVAGKQDDERAAFEVQLRPARVWRVELLLCQLACGSAADPRVPYDVPVRDFDSVGSIGTPVARGRGPGARSPRR